MGASCPRGGGGLERLGLGFMVGVDSKPETQNPKQVKKLPTGTPIHLLKDDFDLITEGSGVGLRFRELGVVRVSGFGT
jgi:hypothetical protein